MARLTVLILAALVILSMGIPAAEAASDPEALIAEARREKAALNITKAATLLEEAQAIFKARGDMERYEAIGDEIRHIVKVLYEYTLSEADLAGCAESAKLPLTREEIDRYVKSGELEHLVIDGKTRYFSSCLANVFQRDIPLKRRHPEMMKGAKKLLDNYRWIILNPFTDPDIKPWQPYGAPQTFLGEAELTLRKEKFPASGTLRLWVPYPVTTTSQTDVQLLELSHPQWLKALPDRDAQLGCLYFEIPLPLEKDVVEIEIKYLFSQYTVRFAVDPEKVGSYDRGSELYRRYTRSEGNCTVTPEIRALAEGLTAGEKNPYLAARRLYDFVLDKVRYSFTPHLALDALTKPESVYVYEHRYGDCGAQSLFFSALCRAMGIPARCLGGMQLAPEMSSYHFWAQVFIPGYGWLPVDTSVAQGVLENEGLTADEERRIRDFFFGAMDPYRLYLQTETDLDFSPQKRGERLVRIAFQMPDAQCDGCETDPALLIEYETEFKRVR